MRTPFPRKGSLAGMAVMLPVSVCLASAAAMAQELNYGRLEALFGEPVTTSATGAPQKAADVPANMQIISADEIRRSGATTIPDILRYYAGVDVRSDGIAGAQVALRGYASGLNPRLLVLIDGRQVYSDDYGYVAWASLPVQLDEIRQIEIVKGPASALFGFNAASGVVNIITYGPLTDNVNVATARGGTDGYVCGDGVATFHVGDAFGLKLAVGGYRANEFLNSGQGAAYGLYAGQPYQHSFSADSRYAVNADSELSAEFAISDSSNSSLLEAGSLNDITSYRTDAVKLGYLINSDIGLINLTAYRNETKSSFAAAANYEDFSNIIYVLQANDTFRVGTNNVLRVGAEFRNNYAGGTGVFHSSIGYDVFSANAMWNRTLGPDLALTNAVRLDHLALSLSNPTPAGFPFSQADYNRAGITEPSLNSGLVYKPDADDTIRFLIGRGIQAPSLFDFGFAIVEPTGPTTSVVVAGNPNLKAVRVSNAEIDYDRTIAPIRALLRTALYYQRNDNLLSAAPESPIQFLPGGNILGQSANIGGSNAAGGEISLSGTTMADFRWSLAYALFHATDHLTVPGGDTGITQWNYEKSTPTSAVDLGLGYSWKKFEADLHAKWQSNYTDYLLNNVVFRTVYQPVTIKDYVTVDARLGYALTDNLTLAVSGQQLNQQSIHQSIGLPIERRGILSATVRY